MIVWIFFQPGAGGDGVANLFEHSRNAVTIDGQLEWRIHRYVDNQVKFWAPNLQQTTERINNVNQLTEYQLDIANSNDKYLIITSHDIDLKETFDDNILPKEKHIKLRIKNKENFIFNGLTKNLIEFDPVFVRNTYSAAKDNNLMDITIDIDMFQSNWEYTKKLTNDIGLQLDKQDFDHYIKIVSCKVVDTTPGVDCYNSYVDENNIIRYKKIVDKY